MTLTGLDQLVQDNALSDRFKGNVAYLCHGASVTKDLTHGLAHLKSIFGKRLLKAFGPQHGFVGDVQDNMVESDHYIHPYFDLKIYSLYSETRIPTDEMLKDIDHLFVDLQDVGTRIYTYIYTMTHLMEACSGKDIEVIILDRPNPINGVDLEGNILEEGFTSFVGRHPLPVRHGLTMAEIAKLNQQYWNQPDCKLTIIPMKNWKREMSFTQTQLPWVMPSPNMPTLEAAYPFVGTVLFEGTNISEGRGTTRPLELIGHPLIEPYAMLTELEEIFNDQNLVGFKLRPLVFQPTFQKHQGKPCGGFQIHVLDQKSFKPWRVSQILCYVFHQHLGTHFQWKQPPYEYEYDRMPIDLINGTDLLRQWIEEKGEMSFLDQLERKGLKTFMDQRDNCLIY